ncbi:hypothetical protein MMC22_005787 [Lobaria immixta]|nr:hypothetical protein [Lobaria immixta]
MSLKIDPPPSWANIDEPNFLHLPRDIRDNIYRQLFLGRNPLTPLHSKPIKRYFKADDHQALLFQSGIRLMRTCKTVGNEAAEILYGSNTFFLRPNRAEEILKFFRQIGRQNLCRLKSLIVDFEYAHELFSGNYDIVQSWEGGFIWSLNETQFDFRQLSENARLRKYEYPKFFNLYAKEVNKYIADFKEPYPYDTDWIWFDDEEGSWGDEYTGWADVLKERLEFWNAVHDQQSIEALRIREDFRFPERLSDSIGPILEVLAQCKALRRLEIYFPDAQRFMAGHFCHGTRKCLRRIQSLTQVSHLTVHGISNLAALECMASSMNLSRLVAELCRSRWAPFLHIESGRPDVRLYPNWRILRSNRYEISLEMKFSGTDMKDRLSGLPTEIRACIYKYSMRDWQQGLNPGSKGWYHDILHCSKPIETWQLPDIIKGREGLSTGFAALLKVSSLFHQETSPMMYRHLSNFYFRGLRRADLVPVSRTGTKSHIGHLVRFLDTIGPTNRGYIRSLDICFNSWISYAPSAEDLFDSDDDMTDGLPGTARASQRLHLERLLKLIQDIPFLDTLRFVQTEDSRKTVYNSHTRRRSRGEFIKNLGFYLKPISKLRLNLRHLSMTGFVIDRSEAECIARLIGAEEIEQGFYPKKLRDDAKDDGWNIAGDFIQKRLTPKNLSSEMASRLDAAQGSGFMDFSFEAET